MRSSAQFSFGVLCAIFVNLSCSEAPGPGDSGLLREWDYANAPERMGLKPNNYEVSFEKMPLQGRLSKTPWSGGYWPTYQGGIAYRWNTNSADKMDRIYYETVDPEKLTPKDIAKLSPSEKYDLLLGEGSYSFTKRERKRTQVFRALASTSFEIPTWEGLCHAWAPATLLYDNPSPTVVTNKDGLEISFGSSDIKGLLSYFLHANSSLVFFASRRCNIDDEKLRKKLDRGEITHEQYIDKMESAECWGINPGALHIILANKIAMRDEGFIADVTRDLEVWNQAVFGYQSRVLSEKTRNFSPKAAPETVKELRIETVMHYTVEIGYSWDRAVTPASNTSVRYEYTLELDASGNIIGGEWISSKRPDFLWMRTKPEFVGPYKPLEELYKKSVADLQSSENSTGETSGRDDKDEDDRATHDRENDDRPHPQDDGAPSVFDRSVIRELKWKISSHAVIAKKLTISGMLATPVRKLKLELVDSDNRVKLTEDVRRRSSGRFQGKIKFWPWQVGHVRLLALDSSRQWKVVGRFPI